MIEAIKLIDCCFKFERASFRSSGGRGVDRLLVMGNRDALVKGRPCYRESRYRESRVYNVKIELRMRIKSYSGTESSSYSSSSSYSVITVLTKPCTFELRMLYYNKLLLHKIDKIKMAGTSREISSAMDENHDEY